MAFSILTLVRCAFGRPPRLVCTPAVWRSGVAELRIRTNGGRRESGAFLLGRKGTRTKRILEFIYYDDIDPTCLRNGIVELDGRRLGAVWQRCSDAGMNVVADIHVHPGGHRQSSSDQENPMIAEVGHLALILPGFAARKTSPGGIGIHEYRGARRWIEHSRKGGSFFHIGWWPG
jgi:proteasome lid subunit RPN8/RPN11